MLLCCSEWSFRIVTMGPIARLSFQTPRHVTIKLQNFSLVLKGSHLFAISNKLSLNYLNAILYKTSKSLKKVFDIQVIFRIMKIRKEIKTFKKLRDDKSGKISFLSADSSILLSPDSSILLSADFQIFLLADSSFFFKHILK